MADDLDDESIEGLSFWEPGGYKKTTKRITDGNQLCNDFVEMVQDRCEVEANYAAAMKGWVKKWGKHIDKGKHPSLCSSNFRTSLSEVSATVSLFIVVSGPEYGSMESAWKANLTAAERGKLSDPLLQIYYSID